MRIVWFTISFFVIVALLVSAISVFGVALNDRAAREVSGQCETGGGSAQRLEDHVICLAPDGRVIWIREF